MLSVTPKFRSALQHYHERKWFPDRHPDPFGEFIDFVNQQSIQDSNPYVGLYIAEILPATSYPELWRAYQTAFQKKLTAEKISPEFSFYYLRALEDREGLELWGELQKWLTNERAPLQEWLAVQLQVNRKLNLAEQNTAEKEVEADLNETEIALPSHARTLSDVLRHFRYAYWDDVADWNDFGSLAKTVAEISHIKNMPALQRTSEDARQLLFPISPPDRVRLHFGRAAGMFDSVRMLFELGKGFFYSGMSPRLPFEQRICGDPSLPMFWGSLFALLLTDRSATKQLIHLSADGIVADMQSALQFWFRYDALLALYRMKIDDTLNTAQDVYISLFQSAFPSIQVPHFLYLFDLIRSRDALYRFEGYRSAVAARERLRELYGTRWYASETWTRRMKDYWNEGFSLSLRQVTSDLRI